MHNLAWKPSFILTKNGLVLVLVMRPTRSPAKTEPANMETDMAAAAAAAKRLSFLDIPLLPKLSRDQGVVAIPYYRLNRPLRRQDSDAHHRLADIAELPSKLQQPNLGADNFPLSDHDGDAEGSASPGRLL